MAELMKGNVFSEREHKVVYPCIAEVKYDEIRVHVKLVREMRSHGPVSTVQFLSYAGNPLANLSALYSQQFIEFFKRSGLTELDCGLEVNGNFNDSYRWVRSTTGYPKRKVDKKTGKVSPELNPSMVKWFLFDIPESKLPYQSRRYDVIEHVCTLRGIHQLDFSKAAFRVCYESADIREYFTQVREEGREGLMVKALAGLYEKGKRTDAWLKLKPEAEADGKITGINQAFSMDDIPLGRAGSVDVLMPDGSKASPGGIAWELGRLMWENPQDYIGCDVQFDYMERDRQGGYRHPMFGRLREAK